MPKLLGLGESPSVGLQKGVVSDPSLTSKSVIKALEKAETMSGVKADSAYASFNGVGINVRNCRVTLSSGNCPFLYEENTCFTSNYEFSASGIPPDEKVLQFIPMGISFERLTSELRVKAITAKTSDIENLIESARLAGVDIKNIVYGPQAAAEALLTPTEREFGTVLVDIGAGSTSVSLFNRGFIRDTTVLSIGGEHLSGDLAIGLRTSLAHAEEILKKYSLFSGKPGSEHEFTGCFDTGEGGKVSTGLIKLIIEARVHEILNIITEAVRGFNFPGLLPGGAVFCGGVARFNGLAALAEEKMRIPVRTGRAETGGISLEPEHYNAFGLIKYGYSHLYGEGRVSKKKNELNGGLIGRFSNWFQNR